MYQLALSSPLKESQEKFKLQNSERQRHKRAGNSVLNAMARTKKDVTKPFRIVIEIVRLQGKSPKGERQCCTRLLSDTCRPWHPISITQVRESSWNSATQRNNRKKAFCRDCRSVLDLSVVSDMSTDISALASGEERNNFCA